MAIAPSVTSSTDSNAREEADGSINAPGLNYFVFALFFIFVGITSLNDVILPNLKELFTLNYAQAMPNGGTLHLTGDGHACRVKDGAWLYLGRIAPVPPARSEPWQPGPNRSD